MSMSRKKPASLVEMAAETRRSALELLNECARMAAEDQASLRRLYGEEQTEPETAEPAVQTSVEASKPVEPAFDAAAKVAEKLCSPEKYRTLTVRETATAMRKSKATVYRLLDAGKLSWSGVRGRIPTELVRRLLEPNHD